MKEKMSLIYLYKEPISIYYKFFCPHQATSFFIKRIL